VFRRWKISGHYIAKHIEIPYGSLCIVYSNINRTFSPPLFQKYLKIAAISNFLTRLRVNGGAGIFYLNLR